MSYFQGKEVPKAVVDELKARSKQLAKVGSGDSRWAQSRQVWFKLTSLASVNGNTSIRSLSSKAPLQNIGGGYVADTLRPSEPAVTSIKVTKQGQIGTSRKVNVELTFFTDEQLAEWEPYLLVPGISLRAEWGWSVGASKATPESPISDSIVLDSLASNAILEKVNKNPNYDGIQGPVTNFSYAVEGDLWKVTVEFIGAATQLASQPINDANCACACGEKDGEEEETDIQLSNLEQNLLAINRAGDEDSSGATFAKLLASNPALRDLNFAYVRFTGIDRSEKGEVDDGMMEGVERTTEEVFITLEALTILISRVTGTKKDGNSSINADGRFTFIDPSNGQYMVVPTLDEDIPTISVDPYVCLLPGQHEKLVGKTGLANEIKEERNWLQAINGLNIDTLKPRILKSNNTIDEFYNPGNSAEGYVGKILVNVKHAYKVYKANESGTYSDFLLALLNDINDVTGNLWEFGIINITDKQKKDANPYYDNLLTIMDVKAAEKKTLVLQIRTKPDSYNNPTFAPIARSISITSKLTDAMKSQALYGNAARGTKDVGNCEDRYTRLRSIGGGVTKVDNQGRLYTEPSCTNTCVSSENPNEDCGSSKEKGLSPKSQFEKAMANLYFKRKDARVASAKEAYKSFIATLNKDTTKPNPACPTMAFPFELQLTLDGIGGFVWGQYVTTDRLPNRYKAGQAGKDQVVWQVTTVEHIIQPGKWETNINTLARYISNATITINPIR